MSDVIILVLIYSGFLIASFILYRKALSIKKQHLYIAIPIYLLLIYVYFEAINYLHILLRERGIFFEFGHSSIRLIVLLGLAYLTAAILIASLIVKRRGGIDTRSD